MTAPRVPSPLVHEHTLWREAVLPGHVMSLLIRQLQASEAAQIMKKAEEQLEQGRVKRGLKKASA